MKKNWKVGDLFQIDIQAILNNKDYDYLFAYIKRNQNNFLNLILKVNDVFNDGIRVSLQDRDKYKLPYVYYYYNQIKPAFNDKNIICKKLK